MEEDKPVTEEVEEEKEEGEEREDEKKEEIEEEKELENVSFSRATKLEWMGLFDCPQIRLVGVQTII